MATKNEIIAQLKETYPQVLSISLYETTETTEGKNNWYQANVFDATANNTAKRNVSFYVLNEGTAEENAYLAVTKNDFESKLRKYMASLYGFILNIDVENKYAIIEGYVDNTKKTYLVEETKEGFRHSEIR